MARRAQQKPAADSSGQPNGRARQTPDSTGRSTGVASDQVEAAPSKAGKKRPNGDGAADAPSKRSHTRAFNTPASLSRDTATPFSYPSGNDAPVDNVGHQKTHLDRWRLVDERGRQRWRYLRTQQEAEDWPLADYEKHFLGLDIGLPKFAKPAKPLDAVKNGLGFFERLQLPSGQWGCEYGGPMFLLPGLVVTWYVTEAAIPPEYRIEICRYLFNRQSPKDGGWGLHIEAESSVFGTAMNYTTLRLLGVDADDSRMIKARAHLHKLGGAVRGPHWAKFWLSLLGACEWDAVNPVPPELWLLPDWVPVAPWRWWPHMRQVFLPMGYLWSRKWSMKPTPLVLELREELYVKPYAEIVWHAERNSIAPADNFHPKSMLLNTINWFLVNIYNPLRPDSLKARAEAYTLEMIKYEDENTQYANLGPVNGPMNTIASYIAHGRDSKEVRYHLDRLHDFIWLKDEGMLANGTNGVQVWDTAFVIQAVVDSGLAADPQWHPMLTKALEFLEDQQILEEWPDCEAAYHQRRQGAWPFSTREQGYTVSDCTAEGLKSVLLLQNLKDASGRNLFPQLVSDERCKLAIDVLLTMPNSNGGFGSYETRRGNAWFLEQLNAAEVFGGIMVEYDYVECTTAVLLALKEFTKHFPDYRRAEVDAVRQAAVAHVRTAQRADGSWYGSWGICFTYAGMFALAALATVGETYATSARVRRACEFLLARQAADGGWGESYRSCETGVWHEHPQGSQVLQTAWAMIALLEAQCPDHDAVRRGMQLIMGRQCADGSLPQEGIEGVFNRSCMISYPNYRYTFGLKALGMCAVRGIE